MSLGRFITGKAATQQSDSDGKSYTLHNQLFIDEDSQIYLVPRYFQTDGYTIPTWISILGGEKMQWDIRPAIGHDFECKFHQELVVKLSFIQLCELGFIKNITVEDKGILICKNIPPEYLELRKATFKNVNAKFKRMMKATQCIKQWRLNLMFWAVHLNAGWLTTKNNRFDINEIYKERQNEDNFNNTGSQADKQTAK